MSLKINQSLQGFNSFFVELRQQLRALAQQEIEKQLASDVSIWLYRDHHDRRSHIKRRSQAFCQRCGSQEAGRFMRNGHRKRQLLTCFGVLDFWLPRVERRTGSGELSNPDCLPSISRIKTVRKPLY